MCRRHCRALFRKHVLPLLYNPFAAVVLELNGHVVSITPVYRGATLALERGGAAADDFGGDEGPGEAFRGRW